MGQSVRQIPELPCCDVAGKPQGGAPLRALARPREAGKGRLLNWRRSARAAQGPPWLDGQSVALLFQRLRARVPQGVLFMRRNRARLARCFWGIGPLRSLSACRQKRGGTISNAVLFVRAPPVLRARARDCAARGVHLHVPTNH